MNINKRLKEIGIRKILGASTRHIASKISKEFVIILVVACLIGCTAGYYLSNMLMGSIWTYHVPVTAMAFIGAITVLLVASIATIGGKIFKAASTIPARMLRD